MLDSMLDVIILLDIQHNYVESIFISAAVIALCAPSACFQLSQLLAAFRSARE